MTLGKVKLEAQAILSGEVCQTFPQGIVAGVLGVDAGVDFDPAVVIAVPFFHNPAQFCGLFVGMEVEFLALVDEPIGRKGQIRLHAAVGNDFGCGFGIVVQVTDGGDAEAQALRHTQHSGGLGAAESMWASF